MPVEEEVVEVVIVAVFLTKLLTCINRETALQVPAGILCGWIDAASRPLV